MPIAVDVSAQDGGIALDAALAGLLDRAVSAAAAACGVRDAQLSLALLDDAGITDLNERYLGHDGPTDVLAFALYQPGELPVGDIYLGYEQAARQAVEQGVPLTQELARLAVHGTLHVLGEEHPEGEERTGSPMWQLQERIVSALFEYE